MAGVVGVGATFDREIFEVEFPRVLFGDDAVVSESLELFGLWPALKRILFSEVAKVALQNFIVHKSSLGFAQVPLALS